MQHVRNRPRHGTVVAYLALLTSLGGTGYAAATFPRNSVGSAQIRDGSVRLVDLSPGARPIASSAPDITVHTVGEKGDKGDVGSVGGIGLTGAIGPTGLTGSTGSAGVPGPPGPPGSPGGVQAFGYVRPSIGAGTFTQGATLTQPGFDVFCVTAPGISTLVVSPDQPNTLPFVLNRNALGNNCPVDRFEVVMSNNSAIDTGFFFIGN